MQKFLRTLKIIGIIVAILAVVVLVFYLTGNKEQLHALLQHAWNAIKAVWLWIVGLFGAVWGFGKYLFSPFSGAKEEIQTENERIKKELESIRTEVSAIDDRLKRERDLHQREIAMYEKEIAVKDRELAAIQKQFQEMKDKGFDQWWASLPEEHRTEIEKKALDNVVW